MATVNQTENFMSYESLALVWRPYIDGDVVERAPVTSVAEGLFAHVSVAMPIFVQSIANERISRFLLWRGIPMTRGRMWLNLRSSTRSTHSPYLIYRLFSISTLNITYVHRPLEPVRY